MTVVQDPQLTYGERRTAHQRAVDEIVLARVKRGIALLEREYGPDWADKINLKKLDLADGFACVLGQVYGSYGGAVEKLWPADELVESGPDPALTHGFYENNARKYRVLQAVWEDVLTPQVRKENSGVPDRAAT